jgi:PilZ domain
VPVSQYQEMRYGNQLMVDQSDLDETVPMTQDTMTTSNERRSSQRFKISAPLTVIVGENEIPAYTRDLSNRGVYFFLTLPDSTLIDRDFEFLIEMPSEITLTSSCRIRCCGKLVRKEVTSRNLTGAGIAAEILNYSILRDGVAPA